MTSDSDISLDGRVLQAVENVGGEVGGDTIFTFEQTGNVVSASYSGADVREGYLIGTIEDNEWDIRYVQINHDGETATGHSVGRVSLTKNGRVRVDDDWEWESKPGEGHSILEEVEPTGDQ